MFVSTRNRMGALAAGLACLLAASVQAQQTTTRQVDPTRPRDAASDRATTGQFDRAQFGQRTQPGAGNEDQQVEQFLANCLLKKNQGEVEIGQFAQQQAQNPQVKQFAQMLVRDHQQIVQQLQQIAGAQGNQRLQQGQSATENRQDDAQRQAGDTTRLPGATQPATPSPGAVATTANKPVIEGSHQASGAIGKLQQIEDQIAERAGQALREELQSKSGAEFDKCFVGSQIASHMQSLAALEVISQQGPGQLRQIAQQAQPKVQQHLEHAKQLAKQLESGAQTRDQAERPATSTQR